MHTTPLSLLRSSRMGERCFRNSLSHRFIRRVFLASSPPLTLPHPSDPPHAFLFFLYYSFYIFQHIFPIFCQGLTLTMFLYFYSKCVRFRQVSISFFTTERYFLNGKKPTNAVRPTQLVSRSSDSHSRRLLWLALVSVSERGIRHVR